MKTLSILSLWLASCILSLGAGALNGVAVTHWNGIAFTAWNGSGVSAAGGGGGGGGYTLVIEGSKSGPTGDVTSDAADTTGVDLLIVPVIYYGGTPSLTDSKSNTYTGLTSYGGNTGTAYFIKIFYCIAPTVGSGHTFTVSSSSYNSLIYAGFSKTSPLFDTGKDTGYNNNGGFTTAQPGSLTPSQNDCLVFSAICWNAGGDGSIDSGFTLLDQVQNTDVATFRGSAAYKIQTTATAENPTWTITTGSNTGGAALAVFK